MRTTTKSAWSAPAIAPPERWREFVCAACGARDRRPVPPDDGMCHGCRRKSLEASRHERLRRLRVDMPRHLRAAGVPDLLFGLDRAAWEKKYGAWDASPNGPGRLAGWPANAPGAMLLIYGDGDLATFLGTAVFGEAICAGLAGRWTDAADWLRRLRGTFRSDEPSERVWESHADAEVSMLSGLGAASDGYGGLTAWSRSQVAELIAYRRSRRRPTILTSRMRSWKEIRQLHSSLHGLEIPLKLKVE